jgi:4-hydroxy-L-threonine phosphate dehydrogenase PdxA
MMSDELPLLAITMGDPAGIGPEVVLKIWSSSRPMAATAPEL